MTRYFFRSAVLAILHAVFLGSPSANEARFITGNVVDESPKLFGPVLNLEGGGRVVRDAIQLMIDRVRGCADCDVKLDVVILTWSAIEVKLDKEPGLNTLIQGLNGVDSVELIVAIGNEGISDEAIKNISKAELVYFDGGRQCNYISNFRGGVRQAVRSVYKRGGGIGGMSAGQAIQGDFVFDGCSAARKAVISADALADPYAKNISFSYGFFNWKYMKHTLTDQHVVEL